jgi:hypothetical protein
VKYGDLPSRMMISKLSNHVFARDGVDKSIFDFVEQTKTVYEYVEAQLRKFSDVYCNPNENNPQQFDYKSEVDKERFITSVRKLMDSEIESAVPYLDVQREDLSTGMFFRGSDTRSWLSSSDLAFIFKFIDAQDQKESCE